MSPQFPTLFCSNYSTLSTCIAARSNNVSCGWCESSNNNIKCFPGNVTQPSNNQTCGSSNNGGSGGDGGWYFEGNLFILFIISLSHYHYYIIILIIVINEGTCDYNNCTSCTQRSSCGWCESTQKCVPGNSSSAIEYSCPSYRYSSCTFIIHFFYLLLYYYSVYFD